MDPHTPTTATDIDSAMATPKAGLKPPLPSKEDSDAATKEVYASLSNALSNLAVRYSLFVCFSTFNVGPVLNREIMMRYRDKPCKWEFPRTSRSPSFFL
jgi:hypothetical protein